MAHGNQRCTRGAEEHFCQSDYSFSGAWIWNFDDDYGEILDEGYGSGLLLYDCSFSISWDVVC